MIENENKKKENFNLNDINEIEKDNNELHGGNIYLASGKSGFSESEILDYSTNVNPMGVPESLKKYIAENLNVLASYPDPFCCSLRKELAQYLGVGEENIIAGNGAAEIIFLLFEILKPENVLITAPSFAEYELAAKRSGCRVHCCSLKEEDGFKIRAEEIIRHANKMKDGCAKGRQMIFLCNPNNPTAKVIKPEELDRILKYTEKNGMILVIDETFIELVHSVQVRSLVKEAAQYKNLFVIRAFTKLFALPGLRIGFGIGDRELIRELWNKKLTWSVNSLAASAGGILLKDIEYLNKTGEWLSTEPIWFYKQLNEIPGLKFYLPETSFILGRITGNKFSAAELKKKMLSKGILIRDCSNFRNLDESYFRLAVKDRVSNLAFLDIFRESIIALQQPDGRRYRR